MQRKEGRFEGKKLRCMEGWIGKVLIQKEERKAMTSAVVWPYSCLMMI